MTFLSTILLLWGVGLLLSVGASIFWHSMGRFMVAMGAVASISAYVILIALNANVPFLVAGAFAILIGIGVGLLTSYSSNKVRPEEFILVSLAGVEIVRRLEFHLTPLTGGAYGMRLTKATGIFSPSHLEVTQFSIAAVALVFLLLLHKWFKTVHGMEWRIVGRTRLGAELIGVSASRVELLAGSVAGLAGALGGIGYTLGIGYLHPNDLSIDISLMALAAGISARIENLVVRLGAISFILFVSRELLRMISIGGTSRFGFFNVFLGSLIIYGAIRLARSNRNK